MLNARNGHIELNGFDCDYISFGRGEDPLIMLPGVGDGFKTAKGIAVPFAMMYRCFAENFKVYAFSRRNDLPEGFTTADMADDLNDIMEALSIGPAHIFGVSQGGMIAQQMSIRHPDKVKSLVLAVTAPRPNDLMRESLGGWLEMADRDDYAGIMLDTAERSYSEKRLKKARLEYKLLGSVGKPKSFDRFRIQAPSCANHDAYDLLDRITCPTLVIGGGKDRIVTGEASVEIAGKIPDCKLFMYKELGHGLYEEAPGFLQRVSDFCR